MEKYGFFYTSKDAMILYEHFSTNLGSIQWNLEFLVIQFLF